MHSAIFKCLSYTFLSCFIIYLCTMIVNVNRKLLFIIITFTLSIIIPSSIYSETYGWFAGFYNYIPSSIVSAFILYSIIYILYGEKEASINHLWLFNRMLIRPIIHREYDNIQQFNDSHRFNYLFLST